MLDASLDDGRAVDGVVFWPGDQGLFICRWVFTPDEHLVVVWEHFPLGKARPQLPCLLRSIVSPACSFPRVHGGWTWIELEAITAISTSIA